MRGGAGARSTAGPHPHLPIAQRCVGVLDLMIQLTSIWCRSSPSFGEFGWRGSVVASPRPIDYVNASLGFDTGVVGSLTAARWLTAKIRSLQAAH